MVKMTMMKKTKHMDFKNGKNDNDPRILEKSRIKKDEIVSYGWKHSELASVRYEIRKQDVIVTKNDITPLLRHAL